MLSIVLQLRNCLKSHRSTFGPKIGIKVALGEAKCGISQPSLNRVPPGGYGIMVITGVCGTLNSGSIPGSRPE